MNLFIASDGRKVRMSSYQRAPSYRYKLKDIQFNHNSFFSTRPALRFNIIRLTCARSQVSTTELDSVSTPSCEAHPAFCSVHSRGVPLGSKAAGTWSRLVMKLRKSRAIILLPHALSWQHRDDFTCNFVFRTPLRRMKEWRYSSVVNAPTVFRRVNNCCALGRGLGGPESRSAGNTFPVPRRRRWPGHYIRH